MQTLKAALVGIVATVIAMPGGLACGGPGNCEPDVKTVSVTPALACSIATAGASSEACSTACEGGGLQTCSLPSPYVMAVGETDAGACPAVTGNVTLTCTVRCVGGRRTAGVGAVQLADRLEAGAYFAGCAYLEEVSVHAFERLSSELASYGAPLELVQAALAARDDEERHTRLMTSLANRFDRAPERVAPVDFVPRSRFEIARENAVEGCVRETYAAALGLAQARLAPVGEIRSTLDAIAQDECGHAELSWRIADWLLPQLTRDEREAVNLATRAAIAELRGGHCDAGLTDEARIAGGLPSVPACQCLVALLEERVFGTTKTSLRGAPSLS